MKNPVVTIEMMNGDIIKGRALPGDRSQYSQQFYQPGEEGLL